MWPGNLSFQKCRYTYKYRETQKTVNLKNPTKIEEIEQNILLTEIEPLQIAF